MSAATKRKIKLREVNRHLVCRLCRGYYVDATTIAECLHSFCRSCIIKYLEKNSFCPICEVQIHTAKPHLSLRQDKALQDVVYKLVPGLYHNEMQRRREFYSKHPEQIPATTPEQCGIEDRIIFSPDEIISLSLERLEREEYVFESISSRGGPENGGDAARDGGSILPQQLVLKKLRRKGTGDQETRSKRYLRCPAAVDVSHLKKFVRMKYDLGDKWQVDIIHKRVSLPDHYTLMDVAYIYTWKRSGPMRLFYYHTDRMERVRAPEAIPAEAGAAVEEAETQPQAEAKKKEEEVALTNGHATEEIADGPSRVPTPSVTEPDACDKTAVADAGVEGKGSIGDPPAVNGSSQTEVKSETTSEANAEEGRPLEGRPRAPETESVPLKENANGLSPPKKDETSDVATKKEDKLQKTIANLLKNYRKDNPSGDGKVDIAKSAEDDSVTVTNTTKRDKSTDKKKEADVTIEIKSEAKASEYDFESNSPPGKIISLREFTKSEQCKNRKSENAGWMSLQDFRKVLKENGEQEAGADSTPKTSKLRTVPCLKRIEENGKIGPVVKPEEKRKSPTVINIQTDEEDYRKKENRVESAKEKKESPQPPPAPSAETPRESAEGSSDGKRKLEAASPDGAETPAKRPKKEGEDCGAMDLSKTELSKSPPPEQSDAGKKNDENMVEALVSAAQKQNIEPLLRVPQFMKTSTSPTKITPGRNISPSDISQALQFFKDLRSDIRVLEAKAQLSPQSEQFSQKLNATPFQLYQQQMDLIKRLKKHQMMAGELQQTPKTGKQSPPSEKKSPTGEKPKGSSSPGKEESVQVKSPVERALTQIQEQFELQSRMKHNLKNLPALLQFYNRPPFLYCPSVSPTKPNQSKMKSPSLSPNLQKSPKSPPSNLPLSMTSPGSSFFPGQAYGSVVNTGLTSEMTFHQMFQNYLSQQEKMNQIKASIQAPRPRHNPPTTSPDFFFPDSKQKI